MTKRKKHKVSDDNVTFVRGIQYFDPIPVDLVIKILSLLLLKSIAKCRCVSKLWSSIIRRPNYDQLFPIKSPATPSLLFVDEPGGSNRPLFFYSSPHPQNPDENSSSTDLRHHHTYSVTDYCRLCPPIAGLVCRQQSGINCTFAVISNPVTGEYVTTPKVTTKGFKSTWEIYFGYDPIDKNFKVLCMTSSLPHKTKVLTLGTGTLLSWRSIQCCTIHYPQEEDGKGICINGVLYYTAIINSKKRVIVCFGVRSEKFSFIDIPDEYLATEISARLILIDYKGELGVIDFNIHFNRLALWILKNPEERKWSRHICKIPQMPPYLTRGCVYSAGMIGTGEIILYNKYSLNNYYFNLERNVITRVEIELPTLDRPDHFRKVYTFTNFVENAKLM